MKVCVAESPPGSEAVTVTMALPAPTAVTRAVAPETAAVATPGSDETAVQVRLSPSGSLKYAASSTDSVFPTSTVNAGMRPTAMGGWGSPQPTAHAAVATRAETPQASRSAPRAFRGADSAGILTLLIRTDKHDLHNVHWCLHAHASPAAIDSSPDALRKP